LRLDDTSTLSKPYRDIKKKCAPLSGMTDEELIKEILSGYRRVATMIFLLAGTQVTSSIGTVAVDAVDPQAALDRDQLRDR
jgi:hypothetical protein